MYQHVLSFYIILFYLKIFKIIFFFFFNKAYWIHVKFKNELFFGNLHLGAFASVSRWKMFTKLRQNSFTAYLQLSFKIGYTLSLNIS